LDTQTRSESSEDVQISYLAGLAAHRLYRLQELAAILARIEAQGTQCCLTTTGARTQLVDVLDPNVFPRFF
jgi:hypothetical protein